MNKIKLFIAALGAGSILAVIILFVSLGEIEKRTGGGDLKIADEIKWQEQTAAIVKTEDFDKCGQLTDELYKIICVNNIALNLAKETQDVSYCQKLDDKLIRRGDCERQIVFNKALEKNDIKICEQITEKDKADICYNNFLIAKNFNQNPEKFNCFSLRGAAARTDCEKAKPAMVFKR